MPRSRRGEVEIGTGQHGQRLSGKVALVTGAGRGIGREIALAYAREGASLVVAAEVDAEICAVAVECDEFGVQAAPALCDVRDEQHVSRTVRTCLTQFGRIDILVNAAGIDLSTLSLEKRLIQNLELQQWRDVFAVNVEGTFLCSREVIAPLSRNTSGGAIINLSSGTVRSPLPGYGSYASSKFAVEGLTKILAQEVASAKIRVNCLQPGGLTDTAIVPGWMRSADMHKPSVIRECAVYLASDESALVTGSSFIAMSGIESDIS